MTAAQMDSLQANDYNWTVSTKTASYTLVAADKGTRVVMNAAGATTITVNDSLFSAGDTLFIQNIGAGVSTVTAGTATVSSAGPLAIPQYGSGTLYFTSAGVSIYFPSAVTQSASGLTLISTTTIGSAVSSVTVSNAFSATYDSYKINISGGASSNSNIELRMTLGATATGYAYELVHGAYAGTALSAGAKNQAYFRYSGSSTGTTSLSFFCDLYNPYLSEFTYFNAPFTTTSESGHASGYLDNTTSYTDFTITTSVGTITGGTIRVYGYANS